MMEKFRNEAGYYSLIGLLIVVILVIVILQMVD